MLINIWQLITVPAHAETHHYHARTLDFGLYRSPLDINEFFLFLLWVVEMMIYGSLRPMISSCK